MAYVQISTITDTSIKVRLAGLGEYVYTDRKIHWYLDGIEESKTQSLGKTEAGGTSGWKTFSGLEPNTVYDIYAVVEFTRAGFEGMEINIYTENGYMPTTASPPFPTFAWTYACANKNGNPQKSTDGYKHTGYFYVGADEWNELIDAVLPRIQKHYPNHWNTVYAMTKVKSGWDFDAKYFNQVRQAIGVMESTGIGNKKENDVITVSDLNKLMDCVNAITK